MQGSLVLFKLLLVVGYTGIYGRSPPIAVNNYLLIWRNGLRGSKPLLQYQCIHQQEISRRLYVEPMEVDSISIGKQQNESQLHFVVAGVMNAKPYMSKITVHCQNNTQIKIETVLFNESNYNMNINYFVVTIDPHGRFAIGYTPYSALFYDLISLKHWFTNITWPGKSVFLPTAVDIKTPFLYVVGSSFSHADMGQLYSATSLCLMMINFTNSQYDVNFLEIRTLDDVPTNSESSSYLSVSVNYYNEGSSILVGIPPINTIHLFSMNYTTPISLQHISSKRQFFSNNRIGYGTDITWLNQGNTLVVLCTHPDDKSYSILYYYDMLRNEQITNDTIELSIFPNKEQIYPEKFNRNIRSIVSSLSIYSTLYGYNNQGELLIIPPSLSGYYSIHYRSVEDVNAIKRIFSFIPNRAQCSPGTYKNGVGVWPCGNCKPTETNSSILQYPSNKNTSIRCPQCMNKTACPLESITEINWLPDIKQNVTYPESPETDIFGDVLLSHIFQTNWNLKSPFFISIIALLVVLIIAGLLSVLKLSKRFASKQQCLIRFLRYLDLIGEGKLWFGGLISIIILLLGIFAASFGHFYHSQYPIEKQICNETVAYDLNSFYNAKFDTTLQLLSSSAEEYEQIFGLLDFQPLTLNIELLNTLINCGRVTLEYEQRGNSLPFTCYTNDFILYLSIKLPIHNVRLKLNLFSNYTIEGIRIGLAGPDTNLANNYLQTLNFSQTLKRVDHILFDNPVINLQLTRSINITEGLTNNDNTTYTGLWSPTFMYDVNQLFSSLNSSQSKKETILFLEISETTLFIKNKQKPIARRSEIIFQTVLFIGVCIDLTCMILLILKLWLSPIIIYLIRKLFSSNSFVYRLINSKKSSSETAVSLEIQKLKQQNESMSKRIDTLMELLSKAQTSSKQQTTENEETLELKEKF